MVSVALMAAIVIVLANTPLGMIQLPIIKATTVHIPVILGAILLRTWLQEQFLERCIWYMLSGQQYNGSDTLILCVLTIFEHNRNSWGVEGNLDFRGMQNSDRCGSRMAVGTFVQKIKLNQFIALPIVGFVGSMVNTVTVMGSIYFLFAQQYAEAKEVALTAVFGLVMGTVTASGIPEAIAAAILVLALGKVLVVVFRKMNLGAVNVESAK